jgi:hypothetical protein
MKYTGPLHGQIGDDPEAEAAYQAGHMAERAGGRIEYDYPNSRYQFAYDRGRNDARTAKQTVKIRLI